MIEQSLVVENSPNLSPRSSGSSGDVAIQPKFQFFSHQKRFYQYLTGMFSLSLVGVIVGNALQIKRFLRGCVGIVLLASEGGPYSTHMVAGTTGVVTTGVTTGNLVGELMKTKVTTGNQGTTGNANSGASSGTTGWVLW
jgi:hypothetical protein